VERVNREIKAVMSAIMMDARLAEDEWVYVLPNVNSVLNHSPTAVLGGLSPVTVMTGLRASSQLDVVFRRPLAEIVSMGVSTMTAVTAHVERMRDVIYHRHELVAAVPHRRHQSRPGEQEVDFAEGDYVLVASVTRRDKTRPVWQGPARVVAVVHDRVYTVEDLVTSSRKDIHAQYLKRYADKDLVVTPQLLAFTAFNGRGNVIENIIGHREHLGQWELQIHWESESVEEASWEPLQRVFQDAAATVRRYVRLVADSEEKQRLLAVLSALV
jgi:hypothetical protein